MTHWACSDMHGYYSFYESIKSIIDPEDTVICLGDCGDRGPQSWKTIKAVLSDPQFIYLKGNHEDMLAKALRSYLTDDRDFMYDYDVRLCWNNGGQSTFFDAGNESDPWGVVKVLENLPIEYYYTNPSGQRIALCHAGFTPGTTWKTEILRIKDFIWDREHSYDTWFDTTDYDYVVHGHTPIPFDFVDDEDFDGKAYFYYGGDYKSKINIDAGSYYTRKGILFNLDTFESITLDLTD